MREELLRRECTEAHFKVFKLSVATLSCSLFLRFQEREFFTVREKLRERRSDRLLGDARELLPPKPTLCLGRGRRSTRTPSLTDRTFGEALECSLIEDSLPALSASPVANRFTELSA